MTAPPLTVFWKLIILLAAMVGAGACVGLGFLYAHFFIVQPGTLAVLEQPAGGRDTLSSPRDPGGEADTESARFLATYEDINYYVSPGGSTGEYCLLSTAPWDAETYWEACEELRDGRDHLVYVEDDDGRGALLVPDQFDHKPMEDDGWLTLHPNLLIQPR